MTELVANKPKRKVLSLKIEQIEKVPAVDTPPSFLDPEISAYMVWCPDGDMPKRVYQSNEQKRAVGHAMKLASETGRRFYVMRTWRGFDPE